MSLVEKLPFLQPRKIRHKINGVEVNIYALPVNMVYELKTVVKPLARAITTLTDNKVNDVGRQIIQFKDDSSSNKKDEEDIQVSAQTNVEPLSIQMAELREKQTNLAIDQLVEAITCDTNRLLLGKILVVSLKDQFPGKDILNDDATDLINSIDIGSMVELAEGIIKVNSGAFLPLWERVKRSIKERLIPMTQTESHTEEEEDKTENKPSTEDAVEILG